jgi:hypothetical protein
MDGIRKAGGIRVRLALLACLLVGIRLAAEFGCHSCFFDVEELASRTTVHIHAADSHSHCQHDKPTLLPFVAWACMANQDDQGFLLPDIPGLPVLVSFLALLFLPVISFSGRPLIAGNGRGPPLV